MRKDIIPKGVYCYDKDGYCPYSVDIVLNGVKLPYCLYLKQGGLYNCHTLDNDFELLKEHFKVKDDEIFEMFPLDLLWDSCKECNINKDY
jgi:hypothetical protein